MGTLQFYALRVRDLLLDVSGSRLRYILVAWPIATVPGLLLLPLLAVYAGEYAPHISHAEAPRIASARWLFGAVILAPPTETAVMLLVYYLLHFIIRRGRVLRVLLLAVLAAGTHAFDVGGWVHAAVVFWPFLVMSVALAAWKERRVRDAFVVVTAIHALDNATLVALLSATFLLTSRPVPSPWSESTQTDLPDGSSCASSFQCAGAYTCFGSPPICQQPFAEGHACRFNKECAGIMQCTVGRCAEP
jgi:hypothetical protein